MFASDLLDLKIVETPETADDFLRAAPANLLVQRSTLLIFQFDHAFIQESVPLQLLIYRPEVFELAARFASARAGKSTSESSPASVVRAILPRQHFDASPLRDGFTKFEELTCSHISREDS